MMVVLVLGSAWTLASRDADPAPTSVGAPPSPRQGFSAPEFSLEALDGSVVTLSELRGQPVVVNLWASWCLPCQKEMPAFERAYEDYKDTGLLILGVNLTAQDSEATARAFVAEHGLTFPILLDRDGKAARAYQVMGLPSTYFVDRDGIIQSVVVGGPLSEASIRSRIEDLLTGS